MVRNFTVALTAGLRPISHNSTSRIKGDKNSSVRQIRAAIQSGELSEERYQSYRKLMSESEFHVLSYVERSQKDREFGRYLKSFMKQRSKEG
jgi:hypothetical protein